MAMNLNQRLKGLSACKIFLQSFLNNPSSNPALFQATQLAYRHNNWFTIEHIHHAFRGIIHYLDKKSLEEWTKDVKEPQKMKHVAIIMAGNIPMVGFHDVLSVLISGHHAILKMSSKDKHLWPVFIEELLKIEPKFKQHLSFSEKNLDGFDAIIATGSNSSALHFEQYFGGYPNIIRKARTSVAIVDNNVSDKELKALAKDVFLYYGLGCRNVTKVFLAEGFDLDRLFKAFYQYKDYINHNKYVNNYDYNKAVYLMGSHKIIENGFVILKEEQSLKSPVSVLFYEFFKDKKQVYKTLSLIDDQIQCIVSKNDVPFGKAQNPELNDYADGVNTLTFLSNL